MPGKYSHSHVIANYTSQGIISYPNAEQPYAKTAPATVTADARPKVPQAQPPQPTYGDSQTKTAKHDFAILNARTPAKREPRRILDQDALAGFDDFDDGHGGEKPFFEDEGIAIHSNATSSRGSRRDSNPPPPPAPTRTRSRRAYSQEVHASDLNQHDSRILNRPRPIQRPSSVIQQKTAPPPKKTGTCDHSLIGPDGKASETFKSVVPTADHDNSDDDPDSRVSTTVKKSVPQQSTSTPKKMLSSEAQQQGQTSSNPQRPPNFQPDASAEKSSSDVATRSSPTSDFSLHKASEAEHAPKRDMGIMPKNSYGQISAGRDVKKDDDTVSQMSAAFPPDIGRFRESQLSLSNGGLFSKLRRGFRRASTKV